MAKKKKTKKLVETVAEPVTDIIYACEFCNFTANCGPDLTQHVREEHREEKQPAIPLPPIFPQFQ